MTASAERLSAMVRTQLEARGIRDPRVLEAFRRVPRDAFVPPSLRQFAFDDAPLAIEAGQTISQPYVVALTLEALEIAPGTRVLDIGTGSGYSAALAVSMGAAVWSIERVEELANSAAERLERLGYPVNVICGDGSLGYQPGAPYDAISTAAVGPGVPDALRRQLAVGGRLVMPVMGPAETQVLVRVVRTEQNRYDERTLEHVRYVKLIGEQGYPAPEAGRG